MPSQDRWRSYRTYFIVLWKSSKLICGINITNTLIILLRFYLGKNVYLKKSIFIDHFERVEASSASS